MMAPFAPHLACELWESLASTQGEMKSETVFEQPWPVYDEALDRLMDVAEVSVQVERC